MPARKNPVTHVSAVSPAVKVPGQHIKVHYQDGRLAREIPWDDKALVRWGASSFIRA